ncbi:MAG: LytR/AlgR family response regulator transcription factor, partial [Saprospiraceae bacterium]
VLVDYIIKLKNNQSVAQKLTAQITPTAEKETIEQIVLFAENEKDQLQFLATELLYLQSADNYVEIVWQRNGALEKSLLRGSLQRMEQQITLPHIQRCHRSFIVNLEQVISVSGNAQGYKLHLPSEQILPVARSKSKDVLAQLK